jgi:hypothetical protein
VRRAATAREGPKVLAGSRETMPKVFARLCISPDRNALVLHVGTRGCGRMSRTLVPDGLVRIRTLASSLRRRKLGRYERRISSMREWS